ncbi:Major facilitator superfamily domaingeneral substrate transporter [Penicillium desertorum]|uniref:Major facilitator superfamily domaingeneral substrate transporter n=1 Tax=Penicillium desertorum TaxID=1303715 RepID=A0A9W9X898_9EURO|nr:Major facilitator superfamily domaingeneral substrate transporter [Penicillium desertorum]
MSFPQPTPAANSREHVDEVKETISLTLAGEENGDDNDLDAVAQILMDQEDIQQPNRFEHRKLLRKIDWRIVPLAAWAYGLQFVDKSGLGAAATYGLRDDLHLIGQEYSCTTMWLVGYLAIYNLMLMENKVHTRGTTSPVWSVDDDERCFSSALLNHLLWSACHQILLLHIANFELLGSAMLKLTSWRLIFLTIGLLSSFTGVLMFAFMPDAPQSAKWLSERERAIAVKRVVQAQLGLKDTHFKWEQVQETLRDPHAWLLSLQMLFSQTAGSVTTNFLGIGFGYTALKAQLYTAPNYAVQAVTQLLVSRPPTFFAFFRNKKQPLAALSSIIGVIGIIIIYVTPPEDQ